MDLDDKNNEGPLGSYEFDFLGERYAYSIPEGSLQKIGASYSSIGVIKKDINKRSAYVNQEELEKIANESFAEAKKYLEASAKFQELYPDSHANKSPLHLAAFNSLLKYSSSEFYEKLQIYSQKLEQMASPFGEAQRLLEKIIEENSISKEDPEKAVLQALAEVKKQGKKVVIDYNSIGRLACDLKKNELRRLQNER